MNPIRMGPVETKGDKDWMEGKNFIFYINIFIQGGWILGLFPH